MLIPPSASSKFLVVVVPVASSDLPDPSTALLTFHSAAEAEDDATTRSASDAIQARTVIFALDMPNVVLSCLDGSRYAGSVPGGSNGRELRSSTDNRNGRYLL